MLLHRAGATAAPRLGITVTKKIGGAVTRNHIKRAVRETFRHLHAELPAIDVVIIARKGAGDLATAEIAAELAPAIEAAAKRTEP